MDDLLADFLEETRELLEASESEIIAWEANPGDRSRLDAIFRFVHTVKGNCGFFDFPRLERLSHAAEDALSDLRKGLREPDAALVTAVLKVIDRIAEMVNQIEAGEELTGDDADLIAALSEDPGDDIAFAPTHMEADPTAVAETSSSVGAQRSIRLPVDLLDRVMSGISDMVLARNDLAHRLREAGNQPTIDGPFERLTSILSDVRDAVTRMRMQRVEHLFSAFPRLVRDLSGELGKQVMIDLEGGDVELDREMIEMIRDPMTHIIRNAIDHGFETPAERLKAGKREIGILAITARQSGNTISISIRDDGRGLDEARIGAKAVSQGIIDAGQLSAMSRSEILQLVFAPGLSTAEQISSVSGRGVGLDVVQANLEKIGGSIVVSSSPGKGTEFTLRIPLTLSIIAGLTVESSGQRFAIPQAYVEEIVHADAASLELAQLGDSSVVTFRGERTPCLSLARVLHLDSPDSGIGQVIIFLKLPRGAVFALGVDAIHNHGDMVVKPLAPAVMRSEVFAGSTLLDDGRPILMLDIPSIAAQHDLAIETRLALVEDSDCAPAAPEAIPMAMVFQGFDGRRAAVRLELVHRIETIPAAAIDRSGPALLAVVDGEILPLIGIDRDEDPGEKLRMLRLSDGSAELLHAVKAIEDAAALENELVPATDDPLVEAVTLIGGRTAAVLDGHALFARYGAIPRRVAGLTCHLPDSEWARTILAPLVEAAGYEPIQDLAQRQPDVAIVLDDGGAPAGVSEVIRLRSVPDDMATEQESAASIYRYNRDAVIRALRAAGKGEAA